MAKVRNNIVIHGLSGSLGDQLTIRQDKAGRTIIGAKRKPNPNQEFSDSQKLHQEAFRQAAFRQAAGYAQSARDLPVYIARAAGTPLNPFNVAMADWFHAPEILDVDLDGWDGQAGQVIRVQARDDVQVVSVKVAIHDEHDAVLEQGAATRAEGLWWEYTTTAAATGSSTVLASAQDLPGHITQVAKAKQ